MSNNQKIKDFLASLGFGAIETNIYLGLYEAGAVNIAELSRRLKIPRTTVVRNLEKLTHKGMISKTIKSGEILLIAEVPKKLELLLRDELIKLEGRIGQVKTKLSALSEIAEIMSSSKQAQMTDEGIIFKYYEGIRGVRNIYRLIIESKAKQIYTFLNTGKYFDLFPETHNLFKKFLIDNQQSYIYEIIVGNTVSTKLEKAIDDIGDRCICKFGTSDIQFKDFDFLIYGDKVVLIQINENTPVAVMIQASSIASGLRGIHQMLWKLLPSRRVA